MVLKIFCGHYGLVLPSPNGFERWSVDVATRNTTPENWEAGKTIQKNTINFWLAIAGPYAGLRTDSTGVG